MDSRLRGNDRLPPRGRPGARLSLQVIWTPLRTLANFPHMLGDLLDQWRIRVMRALQGWATERRTLRGIPVTLTNTRPDIGSGLVFSRIDTALGLIQQFQPEAFARLMQDISRIHVVRYPCRAAFFPDSRTCLVELTFSVNPEFNEAQIAASIVHEAMHAHIHATGAADPVNRPDEERLCRQAELEFGAAIPNGEAVVQRALESLQLDDEGVAPVIDWRAAQQAIANADARAAHPGGSDDSVTDSGKLA